MTKFEELSDIITSNKTNKTRTNKIQTSNCISDDEDVELEVSGTESNRNPLVAWADEETEPDIIEQLYRSHRSKPNIGEGASSWD